METILICYPYIRNNFKKLNSIALSLLLHIHLHPQLHMHLNVWSTLVNTAHQLYRFVMYTFHPNWGIRRTTLDSKVPKIGSNRQNGFR